MKVVINRCWGGFGVSEAAVRRLLALGADPSKVEILKSCSMTFFRCELDRHDPLLVQVVEELKDEADGRHAKLVIVEVPDGLRYEIDDYDGMEQIEEPHRVWR